MQKKTSKHLTPEDCLRIEVLLNEDFSLRYIADRLAKSPSSVSRKINKHSLSRIPRCCDCVYSSDCSRKLACGSSSCRKKYKTCSKAKKYCPDYVKAFCNSLLSHPLHL